MSITIIIANNVFLVLRKKRKENRGSEKRYGKQAKTIIIGLYASKVISSSSFFVAYCWKTEVGLA